MIGLLVKFNDTPDALSTEYPASELHIHSRRSELPPHKANDMPRYTLETIVVIILILWLLGAFVFPLGNLIHLLLVILLVVVVLRVLQGRKPI